MQNERRDHVRHRVFGGNAEIQAVIGRGRKPHERARIVDWSRSGMRLRVPSPRRRFLIQKLAPVLFEDDSIVCTLRLPPAYNDIFVNAEVVRVERAGDDPDQLEVGLRFDIASTPSDKLEALAKLLEPRPRSTSGRLARVSGRASQISRQLAAVPDPGPDPRTSARAARARSTRVERAKSTRARAATAPTPAATSARVTKPSVRSPAAASGRSRRLRTSQRAPRSE